MRERLHQWTAEYAGNMQPECDPNARALDDQRGP